MDAGMTEEKILPLSTDQTERPRLVISREEQRLIQRAWPFESWKNKTNIADITTLRNQIIQYFGINEKTQIHPPTNLEDCLQDLREKHNIIDLPLEPQTDSLIGDSGLLVVTDNDGVKLLRPSQWLDQKLKDSDGCQIIMLFHGLPQEPVSIVVLLQRVLKGRSIQLFIIICAALIAVLISLGPTWIQAYIFNEVVPNGQRFLMIQIAAFLLCVKMTATGMKLFNQLVGLRLELYLGLNTTALLVDRLLALPLPFFEKFNIGDLQQRVNSAHALRRALQQSFVAVITAVFVVILNISLVFFKTYSFELCLILLVATIFGPIIDAVTAVIETYIRLKRLNLAGQLQDSILHPLESIETIRSLGLEKEVALKFAYIRHQIARLNIQLGITRTSLRAIILCLNAAVISILFYLFSSPETLSWIGADGNGAIPSQGLVILLLSAFSTINGGVRNLSTSILTLVKVIPDAIRFRPILRKERIRSEVSAELTRNLTSLTLTRTQNPFNGQVHQPTQTVLCGDSMAILHNNPQTASKVLNSIAGILTQKNDEAATLKVIINNSNKTSNTTELTLAAHALMVNATPIFTAGSLEDFVTNYDYIPDHKRLQQCMDAAGIDVNSFERTTRIESGLAAVSTMNKRESLKIQIARALYSQQTIIVLDGVIDILAISSVETLKAYCRQADKMLFASTSNEVLAKAFDHTYDTRVSSLQ